MKCKESTAREELAEADHKHLEISIRNLISYSCRNVLIGLANAACNAL